MSEQTKRLVKFNDYALSLYYQSRELEKQCDEIREQLEKETDKDVYNQLNTVLSQLSNLSNAMRKTAEDFFEKVQTEMRKNNVFDKDK